MLLIVGVALLDVEEPQCVTVTVTVSLGQLAHASSLATNWDADSDRGTATDRATKPNKVE